MTPQNSDRHTLVLPSADASGWVVLVVDDESDNPTLVEKVLTFSGAQVYMAKDGYEGLRMLDRLHPSFVLLDLSMPSMDGWEMCTQLRANPKTRQIPVIALTAHAMIGDKEKVLASGFDSYIAKPFRLATFLSEIKRCLQELSEANG